MIEVPQIVVHEADAPDSVLHLFNADVLTGKDGAEIDLLPVVANPPAACDGDGLVMERIIEVRQA